MKKQILYLVGAVSIMNFSVLAMENQEDFPIENLSKNIKQNIFSYFDKETLGRMASVSKSMKKESEKNMYWKKFGGNNKEAVKHTSEAYTNPAHPLYEDYANHDVDHPYGTLWNPANPGYWIRARTDKNHPEYNQSSRIDPLHERYVWGSLNDVTHPVYMRRMYDQQNDQTKN